MNKDFMKIMEDTFTEEHLKQIAGSSEMHDLSAMFDHGYRIALNQVIDKIREMMV